MKNILLLLAISVSLTACKKNSTAAGTDRLTEIRNVYPIGTNYIDFKYDLSGRISDVSKDAKIVVTYPTGAMKISVGTPSPVDTTEILYKLNSDNLPIQRIHKEAHHFYIGFPEPENHVILDQSNYAYDTKGRLLAIVGSKHDSDSYFSQVATPATTILTTSYNAAFVIENDNIKEVNRTINSHYTHTESGTTQQEDLVITEKTVFVYDKKYPNKFDFTNILVLMDQEYLPFQAYNYNSTLANIPNKAITTRIVKDGAGTIKSTETITEEAAMTFTSQGLVLKSVGNGFTQEFYYRKM